MAAFRRHSWLVFITSSLVMLLLIGHRLYSLSSADLVRRITRLRQVQVEGMASDAVMRAIADTVGTASVFSSWVQAISVATVMAIIVIALRVRELRWTGVFLTASLLVYLCMGMFRSVSH